MDAKKRQGDARSCGVMTVGFAMLYLKKFNRGPVGPGCLRITRLFAPEGKQRLPICTCEFTAATLT